MGSRPGVRFLPRLVCVYEREHSELKEWGCRPGVRCIIPGSQELLQDPSARSVHCPTSHLSFPYKFIIPITGPKWILSCIQPLNLGIPMFGKIRFVFECLEKTLCRLPAPTLLDLAIIGTSEVFCHPQYILEHYSGTEKTDTPAF